MRMVSRDATLPKSQNKVMWDQVVHVVIKWLWVELGNIFEWCCMWEISWSPFDTLEFGGFPELTIVMTFLCLKIRFRLNWYFGLDNVLA